MIFPNSRIQSPVPTDGQMSGKGNTFYSQTEESTCQSQWTDRRGENVTRHISRPDKYDSLAPPNVRTDERKRKYLLSPNVRIHSAITTDGTMSGKCTKAHFSPRKIQFHSHRSTDGQTSGKGNIFYPKPTTPLTNTNGRTDERKM